MPGPAGGAPITAHQWRRRGSPCGIPRRWRAGPLDPVRCRRSHRPGRPGSRGSAIESKLLVVDDDPLLTDSLAFLLRQEGYDVAVAETAAGALDAVLNAPPDLVLLDVGLPDLNGVEACRRLRAFWGGSIIMLTARRQETDTVIGLDAGADDYVTKPFAPSVLLARIRAGLRRVERNGTGPGPRGELIVGHLRMDRDARTLLVCDRPVHLSAREFDLLQLLVERPGTVLTRRHLFDTIWGADFYGDERALDVYIRALRKKIEPDPEAPSYIQTVRGVGYRLTTPDAPGGA